MTSYYIFIPVLVYSEYISIKYGYGSKDEPPFLEYPYYVKKLPVFLRVYQTESKKCYSS